MKSNKGFTLIEMAVVLAIIAILAAILTPLVTGYIDQARTVRANADVSQIQKAIILYKRDTGFFPAFDTLGAARASSTASKVCLTSGTNAAATVPAGWTCGSVGLMAFYLNVNSLGLSTGDPSQGGAVAFRGPYLDGLNGTDPWGTPYWVNSKYLATAGADANFWAFAASMGPDGAMSTTQAQLHTATLASGGDDIISLIR